MKRKTCIRFYSKEYIYLVFFQVTTTGTLKNNHCHRITTTAAAMQGKGKTKMCISSHVPLFFSPEENDGHLGYPGAMLLQKKNVWTAFSSEKLHPV